MTRVLVVGTDTGVGKTWLACGLARALVAAGRTVAAIKPLETGCGPEPSPDEDGVRLAAATGQARPRAALHRYRAALAPAVAAEEEGGAVGLAAVVAEIEQAAGGAEVLLLEGAGGLLSPLGWDWHAIHLAQALGAAALLVTSDRLGCLSHTALAVRALEAAGVPLVGIALSAPPAPDASTGRNAKAIARLTGVARIAELPRATDPDAAAAAAEAMVPWLPPPTLSPMRRGR